MPNFILLVWLIYYFSPTKIPDFCLTISIHQNMLTAAYKWIWELLVENENISQQGKMGAASIPKDYLIPPSTPPQLGAVEIITHWLFRPPLQELTFTRAHSSLKQSEIGMPFQILLKVQRMVWLGLPLWWELGTNFPYHRSWWMNVIRRITSKNSDSDRKTPQHVDKIPSA